MSREDLARVRRTWDELAAGDDLFGVIYGYPFVRGQSAESFFASGEREIGRVLRRARRRRLPRRREAALDFGCGAGRLTQALARRFDRVVGVDVSPVMIEAARRLNRHGGRCEYVLNEEPSLARFGDRSVDLVYSNLVLQHMPPALALGYVGELARVLRPGGLLVFTVPSERAPLPRLPRRAVLAELVPQHERLRLAAGAPALVQARVRNRGSGWWLAAPGEREIRLGNHWLDAGGRLLVRDDGRSRLPHDVGPGDEAELALEARAPAEPGDYVLELDLVQEGVGWFAERRKLSARRSPTARIAVEVNAEPAPAAPAAAPPASEDAPRMEMHALPREQVEAALAAAGTRLLAVREDEHRGLGWRILRYEATRA